MIKLAELMAVLSQSLEAQRQLEQCRKRAPGDVEYFCYGYKHDLKRHEAGLEQALNEYIEQRIAQPLATRDRLPTTAATNDGAG